MHISYKKFIEEITVICSEAERVKTQDWLTNNDYEFDPDLQFRSNKSSITARKSTTIHLLKSTTSWDSEVQAAKLFIEAHPALSHIRDNEYYPPKIIDSTFPEYSKVVVFRVRTHQHLSVYIKNHGSEYIASGWSNDTS